MIFRFQRKFQYLSMYYYSQCRGSSLESIAVDSLKGRRKKTIPIFWAIFDKGAISIITISILDSPEIRPFSAYFCTSYKVPLRDVPRGVAQERTEKHTACDILSYAYDIMLRRCEISVLYEVPVATCMYHTAAETRRPTDCRVR